MKPSLAWSSAGILLGILASLSPGLVFMGLLSAATAAALARFSSHENRRFLPILFLGALLLRISLSAGLDLLSWKATGERPYQSGPVHGWDLGISDKTRSYLKIGDSDYFSQRGYATAQFVEGSDEPVISFRINQYGKHGYVYCIGWFYHLFGFSPCAVKLINCWLGSLAAVLVVLLGQRCFGTVPARWAGVLTAVFPSFILWSATNLKDIPLAFFTLLILVLYTQMTRAKKARERWVLFLLVLGALGIHTTFRSPALSVLLAGSICVAHGLTRLLRTRAFLTLTSLFGLSVSGVLLSFWEPAGYRIRQLLSQLFNWHIGFVSTPGSSYTFLPDLFYKGKYPQEWLETGRITGAVLLGMGKGVLHYLFEPFPWNISNLFLWITYPQMVIWYALFPFALIGFVWGLRKRQGSSLAVILTLTVFTLASALASGNIGTVFRQRDTVMPLFLILGCAGLHRVMPISYLHASILLKSLSGWLGRLRISFGAAARSIAKVFWNDSLPPLRYAGIFGMVALAACGFGRSAFGQPSTDWERIAGAILGTLSLLALFCGGTAGQVVEGSRALRFLKRP